MYGMEHFMDKDVVMVSINYRLAIMGGLYLDKDNVPGNQSLRDQILALQWVQENIGQFGGDKDKVTIFGGNMVYHCTTIVNNIIQRVREE